LPYNVLKKWTTTKVVNAPAWKIRRNTGTHGKLSVNTNFNRNDGNQKTANRISSFNC
jgi:hypothetical protein